jgi:hypothetical protein
MEPSSSKPVLDGKGWISSSVEVPISLDMVKDKQSQAMRWR